MAKIELEFAIFKNFLLPPANIKIEIAMLELEKGPAGHIKRAI